ncbi:MAG: hypothetical protein NTY10_01480 [Candidatus Omnitrophica bacterium]|nr:hypothetical protein [Candidatus Omnitrophota bacterium]
MTANRFANAYKGMSSLKATDFLARLLYLFGGTALELLQTDNGPEIHESLDWLKQTKKMLREKGLSKRIRVEWGEKIHKELAEELRGL